MPKLLAVGELGTEKQRLNDLRNRLLHPHPAPVLGELHDLLTQLGLCRNPLQNDSVELRDHLLYHQFAPSTTFCNVSTLGGPPILQAFFNDFIVAISLPAVSPYCSGQDCHLGGTELFVLRPSKFPVLHVLIEPVHVPCVIKKFHGRDAVLNAVVAHALSPPFVLTLPDDLVILGTIRITVGRPDRITAEVFLRLGCEFLDHESRPFVGADPLQDRPDILLVKTAQKIEVLMAPPDALLGMTRRTGIGNFLSYHIRQQILMPGAIDFLEQALHEGVGPEKLLAPAEGLPPLQLALHECMHVRVVHLHDGLRRHVLSNSLRVSDHRQEVAGSQPGVCTVANPNLFREQEWVRNCPSKLVPAFRLGAPVNSAIAADRPGIPVNIPGRIIVEQAIDLLIEDKLAD